VALASVVGHGALLDVGAGGGLPGLPFAILRPDVPVTLLEPRSRRAAFLRAAVHELGLTSVKVAEGRVELPSCRLPRGLPHRFAVVSSRATFPPEEWLRVGSRLVEPGGRVVLYLSGPPNAAWGAPVRTLSYTGRSGRERSLAVYAGAERST
jgi:16S rRNA (guanine527-N7)-methyltransferase